jgi:EAL domain-containing protein (putative c-di-GMP-specific phosphodiesterase class I)/DNA-binding NarL/FixJ family response regulator
MRHPEVTRALLVEHHTATARRVSNMLKETAPLDQVEVVQVADGQDALDALQHGHFAVVLVGLASAEARGLELLEAIRILAAGTPLIVWAAGDDPALHRVALDHGASIVLDARTADAPALAEAVEAAVSTATFELAVRDALRRGRATGTHVAVLQLQVADWATLSARWTPAERTTLGHAVHERLAGRLAADDVLLHLGGGRHGIVAADPCDPAEARSLALALANALDRPISVGRETVTLTAACGWTLAPGAGQTAEAAVRHSAPTHTVVAVTASAATLPRAAPAALPVAPTPARSAPVPAPAPAPARPRVASHIRAVSVADAVAAVTADAPPAPGPRRSFPRRLRTAIAAGELVLHYQPIVRLGDDTIPVVEALVRWKLPTEDGSARFLPPSEFIPLAEETGAIEEIGVFALTEACRQMREWDDRGLAPVRVAVNLSARELCSPALPVRVADALAESGVSADRLELELTESMFADPEGTAKMLRRLRALGVRVAIDDFGTGYSSLGYLTRFAVDVIKVDGAFIRRAADDDDAAAEVVRAIVAIAHQLELEVVAEGVETTEQLRFVQGANVDLVQGFLFCEPLPADAAGTWLAWAEEVVARRAPAPGRLGSALDRREQAIRGTSLVAGAGAGFAAIWPVRMPASSVCPPSGEGLIMCQLQHGWAPTLTLFMIVLTAVFGGVDLARRAPGLLRRYRDPEWRARRARRPGLPAPDGDPVLLAATWGAAAPPNTVAAATAAATLRAA